MGLQVNLEKSLEENLKANGISTTTGGRRRRRGGAKEDELEAARPAAEYALVKVLKSAYESLKPAASSATQAAVAAAIMYAADQAFRGDLCDPLARNLAGAVSMVPIASAYVSRCDNAMMAYNTAITSSILLVSPLLMGALKTAGSMLVPDGTVDSVATKLINALKNPGAAAAEALMARSAPPKKEEESPEEDEEAAATAMAEQMAAEEAKRVARSKSKRARGGRRGRKGTRGRKVTRRR